MCGITGYWNRNISAHGDETVLRSMAATIAHRGPDDEGYYTDRDGVALAHKRLSIIDLSASGHQPMYSSDKRFILIYNGEIYNYLELGERLKKQGIQFRGHSDTEVLLEYYRLYGEACLNHFNGMFAFVIWDTEKKEIFAARDRIGIKPFYYYISSDVFVFGSEIKALLKHPKVPKEPNSEAIFNYLTISHQLDHQTWFKGIYVLEPGRFMKITRDQITKQKYWEPKVEIDYSRSYSDVKDELREKIFDAIKLHQRSDVPVGSHLSGGVDSSTIVAIASKMHNGEFHTFSSSFSGLGKAFDETREIKEIKDIFKTIHHQVSASPQKAIEVLPQLIHSMDEPVVGPAMIPMYFVNKLIYEQGIRVVNGGQGVDELFGGYIPSYTLAARNLISLVKQGQNVPFSELARIPSYLNRGGTFKRFYNKTKSAGLSLLVDTTVYPKALERYYAASDNMGEGAHYFEKNMLMALKYYLPGLLQQEDRMSMAWSIESRVPFLDHRLVEFSLKIPSYFKVKGGILKSVFRDAVRGTVPEMILNNQVKRGYPTPISVWSKNEMATFFKQVLGNKKGFIGNLLNVNNLDEMLNDHLSGKADYTTQLWSALCTRLWIKNNFE